MFVSLVPACGADASRSASPDPICRGTILKKAHFTICHDDDWLIAEWVGYVLRAVDLNGPADRTDDFRPDPDLPFGGRAELDDYAHSGYDRGHTAPAYDFTGSDEAMSETFVLSNMAPQTASLNRGPWLQLESAVRALVEDAREVQVYVGNLFLDGEGQAVEPSERIGANGVAVPTHCFKAMKQLDGDRGGDIQAFALPNVTSVGDFGEYEVSIGELRALSGLGLLVEP